MRIKKKYDKGGKVKAKLKQLEDMPDSKGRKLPKDLPIIGRDRFDMDEFVEMNPFASYKKSDKAFHAMEAKRAARGLPSKYKKGGKYDPKKAAMMKGLEAKIKKAKGTPAAAPLVQKYRKLTGVK